MERRFCSKCGARIGECSCNIGVIPSGGKSNKTSIEDPYEGGAYSIKRFDSVALIQGEVIVKQYHIGEFAKGVGPAGKGSASIIVTNKRVISKQDTEYLGFSSNSIEEITLDSIAGVKNYYSQGYTIWRIIAAIILIMIGLVFVFTSFGRYRFEFANFLVGIALCGGAGYMANTSRKPSYLFSIYASNTNQAMQTGVNLRGKLFNSGGYGIVFQYKPTLEAVTMMWEIGACIVDLKTKGDYAIEAWKKA